ncbi:MAG: hypothetical protein FD174_2345 [Geobacteraceae bacterium]|nr:MAG: hypothetical protein FD174_2345 [Geobacteraceae bacterium]
MNPEKSRSTVKTPWQKVHLFPVVAAVIAFLYYGRFLDNFFTFDDFKYLENMFRGPMDVMLGYGQLRLVSNASWWPLFEISRFNPFGYNLFALFLYFFNAVLLYVFLFRLLHDKATAFIVSTIFVASGVGADAVFWKATNSSLISLFFYLLTLTIYVNYRRTNKGRHLVLSVGLFVLAMFSKEEAASLPFIIAVIDLLFFNGREDKAGVIRRVAPYAAIILFYMLANAYIFNYLLHTQADPAKLFRFRPIYSLIGGGTAFYLAPDGFVRLDDPFVYVTALLIPVSLIFVKEKKLLIFGYAWVFFTFLPQSLTGLGQFEPRVIVNSISRYLYITSIGSSLVFGAVLTGIRERFPGKVRFAVCSLFLTAFVWINYSRVQSRGNEWRASGAPVEDFIYSLKGVMPAFPDRAHVHVVNSPTGRAFIQQAMRAFYGTPDILWVDDPRTVSLKAGDSLFVIFYNPGVGQGVEVLRLQ